MARLIDGQLALSKDKAAALMLSLYGDAQKLVFKEFKDRELWSLTPVMSKLGTLRPEVVKNVLMDFLHLMHQGDIVSGSFDQTKKLLGSILREDRMSKILDGVEGDEDAVWEQLSAVNEKMLASFLQKENQQTAAVILSLALPQIARLAF